MAVLKAKTRDKIPTKKFGLPKERKYPVNDRAHAANAKARATQQWEKGKLSSAKRAEITRAADAELRSAKRNRP